MNRGFSKGHPIGSEVARMGSTHLIIGPDGCKDRRSSQTPEDTATRFGCFDSGGPWYCHENLIDGLSMIHDLTDTVPSFFLCEVTVTYEFSI